MKKYISYLLTLALLVPAFVSCTQERDFLSRKQKTHTVHFATTEPATRTGLTIEGNMVKPDWRKTDLENIHFFEIDATNAAAPGTADEINLSDDNRTAHFKAAISDDITIIVSPSDGDNGSKGAKSAGVSPFTFAAVVAQMPDKDAYTFVIPSEQHPDAETLKDPDAEFLVGYSRKSYAEQYDYESNVVDLYFDRVAALGRLAISGFVGTGEKVKSVTITATGGMTGKATYPGDFTLGDKNKVNFTKVDEPLVLNYGENGVAAPAQGAFYAYFVAAPGEASVTSIEVLTDQYRYTKTVEGGAKFTFSDEQLLNIDFALSGAIAESVAEDNNTWYKASVLEAGYDYIIVSNGYALKNNGSKAVVAAQSVEIVDGTISPEETEGIIWTANANSEFTEYGTHTLSNGTEHLWRHSDNGTFTLEANNEAITKYMVWNYDGEYLWNISIYNTSVSEYYAYYSSGWKISTTKTAATLFTNRPPVEISFASAEAKYDLDNEEWTVAIPELTAPEGADVTYSSSNEDIATVAADGTVTPKAAGSVRITANVAGDDEHQGGSAYYELTVTSSKITTWYKAEEMVDGETYLIVSHEYVLENNAGTANAVKVDFSGDVILYNAPASVLWEAKATSTSGVFTLQNNGQYLYRVSSGSTYGQTSYAPGASSSASSYYQWSYNSETERVSTKGNSTYFVYYSTNNSKWSMSTTEADHPAALYSSTPGLVSRNLKFSAETVTHDLADGEDVNEPELTGDSLEGVTYASENEQIATVDANTGAVTLTGKTGSVKITASAPKINTYKAESVSYTLTVKNGALGPKTYRKVTAASDLVVGNQYLLVYEEGSKVFKPILDGTTFKKTADNAQSVTISSNTITSDELEDNELTLMDGYYLYVSSVDRYVYPEGGNSGTSLPAESTPSHKLTITINSNGTAKISSSDIANFTWSRSGYFSSTYQATTTFVVCLYKLDDGTTPPTPEKQERNLSFGTDSFSCTLGQPATFPTLSGVTEGVTYSSSDESVATVNASGVVTVNAAGTTIIKAEALESDTYLAGSAQYTLTVNPSAGDMVTIQLKKATSLTAGKKYVLVSNGMALLKNGDDAGAIAFNSADLTISVPSSSRNDVEWTLVKKSGTITRGNEYAFTIGDYFFGIAMNTTTTQYTYTVEVNNGREVASSITIQDHNVNLTNDLIYYAGNSSNYYIYFNGTSWSNGKVSNTATPDASYKTALYEVNDGGGDDPGDDPTPTTATYTKVSSITSGATYLIVSHTDALALIGNGDTADGNTNFISVTPSADVITGTASEFENCEAVITEESSGAYSIYFKKLGQYLYYTSSQSGLAYGGTHNSSNDFSLSTVSSGDYAGSFLFTKSNRYLYYNGTFFKIGGSGSNSGVHLYKKAENP